MWLAILVLVQAQQKPPETVREEFARYAEEIYSGTNPFLGAKVRRETELALKAPDLEPKKRLELLELLGKELVKCGEMERGIEILHQAVDLEVSLGANGNGARRTLALAYLRKAETLNCVTRHNAECCIFPLKGGAVHTEREPAEEARKLYETILEKEPQDIESRWLLNILAMALGQYPDGVSEKWRLPPKAFESQGAVQPFRDIAPRLGVDKVSLAGGVAVEDYDGDGWLDILSSTSDPRGSLVYYRNGGDGTFADLSEAAGVTDQMGGLNMIAGDYDNDGDQDAMVLRGGWQGEDGLVRRSLLQNDGHAHFLDVTRAAGMATPAFPCQAALWADFDGDGWLDFYSGNESRVEELPDRNYPCQLYQSRGQETERTFVNIAATAGVENNRFAKGVAAGDYDNDGDLDLYVSNIGVKRLYENDGRASFRDVAKEKGVTAEGRSFSCWFFDYDNNGWLDIMVWGYTARIGDLAAEALELQPRALPPSLFRNTNGRFRDVAAEVGISRPFLPMGANFGDIDNDGWLDIYLGTGDPGLSSLMPNVLLRNDGGKRFLDVTTGAGVGHLQKGHGVAFADFDNDGDQDIYHELGGFFPVDRFHSALFENSGTSGHWLSLELVGTHANRDAVGTRLRLVLETPRGPRQLQRASGSVGSFAGSPHRQDIGLGDATKIQRLELRWPGTQEPQVFEDVPLDSWLRITEGQASFERLERKTIHF